MDRISRLALIAVCAYIDRKQAILWLCGGMLAGVGLGVYFKMQNKPSPQIADFGSVCGNGIIESASGRKLNPVLTRVAMVFFFWVCGKDHHHSGPYVKVTSAAAGYGIGLDVIDWWCKNEPEVVSQPKACHRPSCASATTN